MSYDVYWVKNRAEKIADFEHPTLLVSMEYKKFIELTKNRNPWIIVYPRIYYNQQ